ncbi:LysR substrate-binding domain-containing protein [Roseivivax sp.]
MNIDPRLRLRHVSAFLAIARRGSVAAAAEELHVTQPAVSKTLRELEEILGLPLFDRVGRRVVLNPAGAAFQRLAAAGLSDLSRAVEGAREAHRGGNRLRIGALPTAATRLLPDAALHFRAARPDCRLRISTGPNWLLLSQLREGSLDLVVGRLVDPARMEGLSFRQLHAEAIVAVTGPDHPLRRPAEAADFLAYPLVLPPPGAVIHQPVSAYLTSLGIDIPFPVVETASLAFARRLLQRSEAIWFISEGVVEEELARGQLRALRLTAPLTAGPVGISLRAGADATPEVAGMIAALEAAREAAG